jgi:hypothetical protein
MKEYRKFWEAGYKVFGLHKINKDGSCGCNNRSCKAVGKHPLANGWQHTPHWSEEQFDSMEEAGQFDSGYGILCKGLLVVDVDARNKGVEAYERLIQKIPSITGAGLIVETGSGGGSKHLYFKYPESAALVQHLDEYKGNDFKSSGYVVGPGSLHASGNRYTIAVGSPNDIDTAPQSLLELLKKPERYRATYESKTVDVSYNDLGDMLSYITNTDLDYDVWIKIGMALHHASSGTAYDLWEAWSSTSSKHDAADMAKKWHSFGKSANPVTLGTLVHYAEAGGWKWPVTFSTNEIVEEVEQDEIDLLGIDLRRPPGFVGEIAAWIEDQCRYKRETISVGAALVAMGNIAGLKYSDPVSSVTTNMIGFCVAASGTGKDSILDGAAYILETANLKAACVGGIKSEQEIVRNLVEHQATFYLIDEIGFLFKKIKTAQTKGGAAYLEGIIGIIMSAYSKGNSSLMVSGDVRKEIRKGLLQELAQIERKIDENGMSPKYAAQQASLMQAIEFVQSGIRNPFLSVLGFTTNVNFESTVDFENATNGFIGRSLLFIENKSVPPEKENFSKRKMPESMRMTIQQIASAGAAEVVKPVRIENYGNKVEVPSSDDAIALLKRTSKALHNLAEHHAEKTGLEALFLRAKELVAKVSFILAVPEGVRTAEHVRWAYALVKQDVETKARTVIGNDRQKDSPEDALFSRLVNLIDHEGETFGVIVNKLRTYKKEDIEKGLKRLVDKGFLIVEESIHPRKKIKIKRYRKI